MCKKSFTVKGGRGTSRCLRCRKAADRLRARERVEDVRVFLKRGGDAVKCLVVVSDPLEVGGFVEGISFTREEVRLMVESFSFTPGTILRDRAGRRYEVKG